MHADGGSRLLGEVRMMGGKSAAFGRKSKKAAASYNKWRGGMRGKRGVQPKIGAEIY